MKSPTHSPSDISTHPIPPHQQNRFYLHGNAIASLQTTIPVLMEELKRSNIDCIAFPDDGAAKRFAHMFHTLNVEMVICGKVGRQEKPRGRKEIDQGVCCAVLLF